MDLESITNSLKEQGYKLTPQRIAIIKLLLDYQSPISATDTYAKVRTQHPNISLDTVYRNLHLLSDLGVVSQINLANREIELFELSHHHHHLICLKCGEVTCVDSCPFPNSKAEQDALSRDFTIVSHAFEVYGYCSGCK